MPSVQVEFDLPREQSIFLADPREISGCSGGISQRDAKTFRYAGPKDANNLIRDARTGHTAGSVAITPIRLGCRDRVPRFNCNVVY